MKTIAQTQLAFWAFFGLVAALLPASRSSGSLLAGQAPTLPLYKLMPNSSAWLRTLPKSHQGDPESGLTAYSGDIRAKLVVSAEDLEPQTGMATAQIWWRRRDPRPENKSVIVTDDRGSIIPSSAHLIETACGVISFAPPQPGTYFVYYLPYRRGGGGAHLQFEWYGCDAETPDCVLSSASSTATTLELVGGPPNCEALMTSATVEVSWLENRPNAAAENDHAVDGTPFNGFTPMELIALPSELSTLPSNTLNLFLEPRENMVRMFHAPPAHWARNGEVLQASWIAHEAEFFTFQVGLYANGAPQQDLRVNFHGAELVQSLGLAGAAASIPAEAFTCFNTGGIDQHGQEFRKQFSLGAGETGSLWIGADLPVGAFGTYLATFNVSTNTSSARMLTAILNVSKGAVSDHGDDDVYNLSRLRWLDSAIGVDGDAAWPRSRFANLTVQQPLKNGGFTVSLVNKEVTIGADGLPSMATVRTVKLRRGQNITRRRDLLASPAQLVLLDAAGKPIDFAVDVPATITNHTSAAVCWISRLVGGGITISLTGKLEMDSYLTFKAMVSATSTPMDVADVQLVIAANGSVARRMFGMGSIGAAVAPLQWNWEKQAGVGNNRLWVGDVDGGVFVTPRGEGDDWVSPTYGKDYPIYPFLPSSWAGAGVGPDSNSSIYGANVTLDFDNGGHKGTWNASIPSAVVCTVFSGPRKLTNEGTQFLFDMMFTPAHPLDLSLHWKSRYLQIGYGGVQYTPPAAVAATGVTVATLHQGIGGIHNGTMVNPYINWPFVPEVVDFMEGFTSQSHALNMQVKFYYTIRELTNHAVELFALKALQGEIILDEDPYTIPQAGYCHAWDCHGGSAWLHQHVMNNYVYCWQQGLANGEIDGAVCDIGTSRWFNYYLEGLRRSVENPPHMDGIYYDGINFARDGMQRIRKTIDRAAATKKFRPLIDMHTGNGGANAPAGVRYIAHFAYADSLWNGEGFRWDQDSDYWLVEVSGLIHGITADRLGGPDSIKGMLYATYRRNSEDCHALWKFWDAVSIDRMEMIGYWEADPAVFLSWSDPDRDSDSVTDSLAPLAVPSSGNATCQWKETEGKYIKGSAGPSGDIGFGSSCGPARPFDYPAMTVAQIQQKCCELGDGCVAFSWSAKQDPTEPGAACARKNWGDGSYDFSTAFNGYEKLNLPRPPAPPSPAPPSPPGVCEPGSILATIYVQYKVRAVVVVSSWCSSPKQVELNFDWGTLGMEPGAVSITQPAIDGVQPGKPHGGWLAGAPPKVNVTGAVNGGVILVVAPA